MGNIAASQLQGDGTELRYCLNVYVYRNVKFPIFLPMLMGFHQVHQFFLLCLLCFLTNAGTWIAYSKMLVSEKKCLNVTSHLTKDEWRNGVHCPVQYLGVLIYMCIYCSYLYMSYLYCIVRCKTE